MKLLSILIAILPGALGAGIPLYKWTLGRRTGRFPSEPEWQAMGLSYPPWHEEAMYWLVLQLFALVGVLVAGLVARGYFKQSFRLACFAGVSAWLILLIIGLHQYGWALAD